jgi:hypothetical protein
MFVAEYPGMGKIVSHGMILKNPLKQPIGTSDQVGYELGKMFQLDQDHCLLVASMDELGGGDRCVGNHGLIISKLADIQADAVFPVNWPDPEYKLKSGRTCFLAKYPVEGGFVPLGARLKDGRPHPHAGTGFLMSTALSFDSVSRCLIEHEDEESLLELMQLRWDGSSLKIFKRELHHDLLGYDFRGLGVSYSLMEEDYFLAPLTTGAGMVVYKFEFLDGEWRITTCSKPFITCVTDQPLVICQVGEHEPSILKKDGKYLVYTRGVDCVGRLYESADCIDFKLALTRVNTDLPQILSKGLKGDIYLVTNPSRGRNGDNPMNAYVRNPLLLVPLVDGQYRDPIIIHDEGGIGTIEGDKIPFIDHGMSVSVFMERQWRHFILYRVCDLFDRSLYVGQGSVARVLYGQDHKPRNYGKPRIGGLFLAEIIYDEVLDTPFDF